MHRKLSIALAAAALITAASIASCAQSKAIIRVDVSKSAGKINPWIFGNNTIGYQKGCPYADEVYWNRGSGIWDPEKRQSVPEMVDLAKNSGFSVSRYPGGTSSATFNWKKAIGPLKDRPEQQFGLPEYLQNCHDIGAEPIITLAVFAWKDRDAAGQFQDAVDLVEYLNAPNDGKHPWAAKRAADGHPEPWNVKWFELGNETDIKENCGWGWIVFSPESYARMYLKYQKAMKAIDPGIKLGAHMETGMSNMLGWPRRVLAVCGKDVDFLIAHTYFLSYDPQTAPKDKNELFKYALAASDQVQYHFDLINNVAREVTGRKNIPIAVTEYTSCISFDLLNTLGTGLNLANIIPVFMQPRNNIVMANYWQFANETFGMVRGYSHKGEKLIKTPDYLVMQLYHDHFGSDLLSPKVTCSTYDTPAKLSLKANKGKSVDFRINRTKTSIDSPWQTVPDQQGISSNIDKNGIFIVNADSKSEIDYSGAYKIFPVQPNTGYRISGWVKTDGLPKIEETMGQMVYSAFYEISDATENAGEPDDANIQGAISPEFAVNAGQEAKVRESHGLGGSENWTRLVMDYVTGPKTKYLKIATRIGGSHMPVKGTVSFRDLSYQKFIPQQFPSVPEISVNASKSFDGKTHKVYLMIVNRNMDSSVATTVNLAGCDPKTVRTWEMFAPLDARNTQEHPDNVKINESSLGNVSNDFVVNLKPHSVTAVEIELTH